MHTVFLEVSLTRSITPEFCRILHPTSCIRNSLRKGYRPKPTPVRLSVEHCLAAPRATHHVTVDSPVFTKLLAGHVVRWA
jgi:hypothetical protein